MARTRDFAQDIGSLTLTAADLGKLWLLLDPASDFAVSGSTTDTSKMTLQNMLEEISALVPTVEDLASGQSAAVTLTTDVTLTMASGTRQQYSTLTFAGGSTVNVTLPSANRKTGDAFIIVLNLTAAASGRVQFKDANETPADLAFADNSGVDRSIRLLFFYELTADTWRLASVSEL